MPVEPVDLSSLAAARLARLRERLAEAPFDALLVTTPEGVLYATGYRSVAGQIFAGHAMAAVVTGDEVTLVCPASDTAPAIESGVPGDRVVPYGRFYFDGDERPARRVRRGARGGARPVPGPAVWRGGGGTGRV